VGSNPTRSASLDPTVRPPTEAETAARDAVLSAVIEATRADQTVRLPDFDPARDRASVSALASVGVEPNAFGAAVGDFRYQFEGEEDLLHLFVARLDGGALSAEEGRAVAAFVLAGVEPGLVWFKPGTLTQHFYVGHDDVLAALA
jgi:hypothetical protein